MQKLLTTVILTIFPLLAFGAETDYLLQGSGYLANGSFKKAIRSYESAIQAKQDTAEAYKGIGLAYYRMGNTEVASDYEILLKAINAFDKSFAINQDADVCFLLGLTYVALSDKTNALKKHKTLHELDLNKANVLASHIENIKESYQYKFINETVINKDAGGKDAEGRQVRGKIFKDAIADIYQRFGERANNRKMRGRQYWQR